MWNAEDATTLDKGVINWFKNAFGIEIPEQANLNDLLNVGLYLDELFPGVDERAQAFMERVIDDSIAPEDIRGRSAAEAIRNGQETSLRLFLESILNIK